MEVTDKLKKLIGIPNFTQAIPNPSASKIALLQSKTNWKENKYDNDVFIWENGDIVQLSRNGTCSNIIWLNDNDLSLTMQDKNKKNQIFMYKNLTGDPIQLTNEEDGINNFVKFGKGIVYYLKNKEKFDLKTREDKFGNYTHVEEERPAVKLYYFPIEEMTLYLEKKSILLEEDVKTLVKPVLELANQVEEPFHLRKLVTDESGSIIILSGNKKSDLIFRHFTTNYILQLDLEKEFNDRMEREKEKIDEKEDKGKDDNDEDKDKIIIGNLTKVNLPEGADISDISPDSTMLLVSHQERDNKYYTQGDFWTISLKNALEKDEITVNDLDKITGMIDHSLMGASWTEEGIFTSFFENTRAKIVKINPDNKEIEELNFPDEYHGAFYNINKSGDLSAMAFHRSKVTEFILIRRNGETTILTKESEKYQEIPETQIETISWKSKDDTLIEGIIRKPANFDPSKKYPLVLIVHGGPSWVSYETLYAGVDKLYYPSLQFAEEEIITVYPNYRGSIGRGQEFLELNVNNLGVGDLWDIESAIDHLVDQGFIDEDKVGCMGWSQGGYISAMATTHSDKFKATSVGAGISDWYSYWATTDIRKFTHDYLSSSPIEDREIYVKTAPMSAIHKANTPTLIQIGENDNRVPLVNATELYRGLVERDVPTHLFVFSGMPHGINKPRENLAVISQNYQWFMHYLKGKSFDEYEYSFF